MYVVGRLNLDLTYIDICMYIMTAYFSSNVYNYSMYMFNYVLEIIITFFLCLERAQQTEYSYHFDFQGSDIRLYRKFSRL